MNTDIPEGWSAIPCTLLSGRRRVFFLRSLFCAATKAKLIDKTGSLQACLSILSVSKITQVQLLEAEARRLRAHYFAPLPTAFPAQGGQTSGFGRAFSPPSFVNSSGSFSSSPESVCSISPYSSPGTVRSWSSYFSIIYNYDSFEGRDAASPWIKPNTAKAEPWGSRIPGASAFTARSAGSYLASKVDFYHAAGGEKVDDVGKLLAELRLGTTAVEM